MGFLGKKLGTDLAFSLGKKYAPPGYSIDYGTYTNASERYVLAKDPNSGIYSMSGSFAANIVADRVIDGLRYILIEEQRVADNARSEELGTLFTVQTGLDSITNNAGTDPLGNATLERLNEDASIGTHRGLYALAHTNAKQYIATFIVTTAERTAVTYSHNTLPNLSVEFDFSVPSASIVSGADFAYVLPMMPTNTFLCIVGYTATGTGAVNRSINMMTGGSTSYAGTLNYGLYCGFVNNIESWCYASYIKTVAAGATKNKDVFYWANSVLPNYLKGSTALPTTFRYIPNHSSTQHAAKAQDTYLFSVDGTASVDCYIKGADQKLYIDVGGVNKFTSASAFTWDMHDTLAVSLIPNTGSGCRVITSGFNSGNADETGTAVDLQTDGDFYLGLRHTTDDLQLNGFAAEPTNEL